MEGENFVSKSREMGLNHLIMTFPWVLLSPTWFSARGQHKGNSSLVGLLPTSAKAGKSEPPEGECEQSGSWGF